MKTVFFTLLLFITYYTAVAQQGRTDSLKSVAKNALADSSKIDALLELAFLFKRGNYDSMYYYGDKARALSEKYQYKRRVSKSKLIMGLSAIRLGDLVNAKNFCKGALTIAEQNNLKDVEAEALNYIGLVYNYLGNYPTSLEYYQKALSIAGALNSKRIFADVQINIGGIYYNLKDYDNALEYWKKTLILFQEIDDQEAMGSCLNNIGLAYADKGQFEKALPYYFQSLKKFETGLGCGGVYATENIGQAYVKMGKSDSAIFYLSKALRLAELCKSTAVQIGALTGLAEVSKRPQNAERYLEKAYEIGVQSGMTRETAIAAKSLSDLYDKQGKTERAFTMFKTFQALQDSIYNRENAKAIGKLEAQYEFELEKNEQEAIQKIENLNKERILSQEKWIKNTFIVGFVLMVFVAAFTYRNFHRKRLSNIRYKTLNKEVEAQKSILISQADELKQLNNSLSELNMGLEEKIAERTRQLIDKYTELENKNAKLASYAFINAHKLRAPVATLLGLIMLFENKVVSNQERDEIVAKIKLCSVELNSIVKELRQILEEGSLQNE
jgi:tetratricopeptide (TPR) repeat protein